MLYSTRCVLYSIRRESKISYLDWKLYLTVSYTFYRHIRNFFSLGKGGNTIYERLTRRMYLLVRRMSLGFYPLLCRKITPAGW